MGLTWDLREDWFPGRDGWIDPTGSMPVWSAPDFRRVAAALPQHRLTHLVAERDGRPAVVAPVLHSPGPGGLLFYDVPAMLGDDRAFGVTPPRLDEGDRAALYPSLAVGTYGAYHGILVAADLPEAVRVDLLGGLLDALAKVAADRGCASSALLYAPPRLVDLLGPADRHVLAVLGAESRLTSHAEDFAGYLTELSSRRRGRVLRERRMYLDGPARSVVGTGPDALGPDLVALRCTLRRRYGLPEDRAHTEAELAALARHCGDRLVVNRSVLDGDTVGFVINLRHGDTLFSRTAGFDYDRLGPRDFCYFNIVYYDMLEWGLPRGVRTLELGLASYAGKRTRGARFQPRLGVFDLPAGHPARAVLADQDATERSRLTAECGASLDTGGRLWT